MSIKIDGKINLLSGHYQDIIISENKENNYRVKVTPNEKYHVKELDSSYLHPKYDGLSDLEKLDKIIDSYLYHNTIYMLTNHGRLKFHSGDYQGINAYETLIDGYQSMSRAMYLKLRSKELSKVVSKIIRKYQEDRIRHLEEILNCQKIEVSLSSNFSSYIVSNDKAYIVLLSKLDNNLEFHPLESELEFLEILLNEFIKKNGNHIDYYRCNKIILNDSSYYSEMEIEEYLKPFIMHFQSKIYHEQQEQYHNITIDEYLCSLNGQQTSTLRKKL